MKKQLAVASKVCGKCGENKELNNESYPHNKRSSDGFDKYCNACWKLISANKRKSGAPSTAQQKQVAKAKAQEKGWNFVKPGFEIVPNELSVELVPSLGHLPKGTKGQMYDGSLDEAIASYKQKYGIDPQILIIPATFILQEPQAVKEEVVPIEVKTSIDKPAKAGAMGKKPKKARKHVR